MGASEIETGTDTSLVIEIENENVFYPHLRNHAALETQMENGTVADGDDEGAAIHGTQGTHLDDYDELEQFQRQLLLENVFEKVQPSQVVVR